MNSGPRDIFHKYFFRLTLILILALPALMGYRDSGGEESENRHFAPFPGLPTSFDAARGWPAKADAWINDHFGFRSALLGFNNRWHYQLFHEFPTVQMLQGENGRVFLAAHLREGPPFSAITSVCSGSDIPNGSAARYFNRMFDGFHAMGLQPKLLIVPSAPAIQTEDLPTWLRERCSSNATPVQMVLDNPQLHPDARAAIYYPLAEMRDIKKHASLFPKTWFHWTGPGVGEVAKLSVKQFWGLGTPNAPALPTQTKLRPSDVAYLAPGIDLSTPVTNIDPVASAIEACAGAFCFPEISDIAAQLDDVSRFRNPSAPTPRRLVIISDSFGVRAAPWYAGQYQSVEHIATNNITHLNPAQLQLLRDFLFRDREHMDLLLLYHDGGVNSGALQTGLRQIFSNPQDETTLDDDTLDNMTDGVPPLYALSFRSGETPPFLSELTGAGAPEPWGRWAEQSAGPFVRLRFKTPLPKRFAVEIEARAIGPSLGRKAKIRIGDVTKEFALSDISEKKTYRLVFDTDGKSDTLDIISPAFSSPHELDERASDNRKLGLGLFSIKIARK